MPTVLVLMKMLRDGVALHGWEEYLQLQQERALAWGMGYNREGEYRTWALRLVSSLSHPKVVDLVVREFNELPSGFRTRFMQECNQQLSQPSSNNVVKGVNSLNRLLGGRLLAEDHVRYERQLVEVNGRMMSVNRRVDEAAAAAEATFGSFVRPANYDSLSPAQKRALNEGMARERRERRKAKGR